MPTNVNSASRIYSLLKSIPAHPDCTQTIEVWAHLFGVDEGNQNKRATAVSEKLGAMFRELGLVEKQMQKANFSSTLYSPAIAQVESAMSTLLLSTNWNNPRQYLTTETFTALAFCGEIIPNEEAMIAPEELSEISSLVLKLEECLVDSELPPRLLVLIAHHIAHIRLALSEYPISGAKALLDARRASMGEILEIKEIVNANRDTPEVSQLVKVWEKINEVAEIAYKADKLTQLGKKALELLVLVT